MLSGQPNARSQERKKKKKKTGGERRDAVCESVFHSTEHPDALRSGARGAPEGGEALQEAAAPFHTGGLWTTPDTARAGQDTASVYVSDPGRQRKGAKHAALAEQRIIIPGVGLAVGSHGEEV